MDRARSNPEQQDQRFLFIIDEIERKMRSVLLISGMFLFTAVVAQKNDPGMLIRANMAEQQASWNEGDIDGFMFHYWNDPAMKFVSKKGVALGWQNVLINYKKSYPDKDAMGELSFGFEEVRQIDKKNVLVIGSWILKFPDKDEMGGYFSLLWELKDGLWVITVDHTS